MITSTKPFSARELVARVESNLKLQRLRREAAEREAALRAETEAAQARLDSLLIGISDQFLVLDPDRRCLFVNDHMSEVTGLRREELLGKSLWELFPEISGTAFERDLRQAMAEQTPAQLEYFHAPWNRWFELDVYPTAAGLTLFCAEVTARKRAEEMLQQYAKQLALITHTAPVFIAHCDVEGRFKFVNNAYAERFGLQPADCIGKRIPEIVGEKGYATFRQ